MNTGEDQNKDRFKNFALFESSCFSTSEQNDCVCFTSLCIDFLVLYFITRKQYLKVLELLSTCCSVLPLTCKGTVAEKGPKISSNLSHTEK